MSPRFIWLGCLTSSSEWNFICFCCVSVRWKEAVLVLWAACKQCLEPCLILWFDLLKGRVCPFPFGRVTLASYSCVLHWPSLVVVQPDQHLQFIHVNHLAFVLATRFWLLHILNILKLQIFLLASCLIVSVFIDDFFSSHSPHKGGMLREEEPCMCLLPDACIFSWVNWRGNRPWWLSTGFVPCVTDGPIAFTCWSV